MASPLPTKSAAVRCRAVAGSDEAEVKRVARAHAQEMTPADGGDFACDTIDGAVALVDDAVERIHATIAALLTFPFFGGEKLVWLKSATFLADDPLGKSQSVLDALEQLTATLTTGLPDGVRFLLSAIGVDKRRSFYKGLAKLGKVEVFDEVDPGKSGWEQAAAELAERAAGERGLRLAGDALELFARLTGGDRRVTNNELDKLDLYLGPERRAVEPEDVRRLVPLSRAGVVFELGNAVSARDLSRALELLDQLLFAGESPIGILVVAIVPTVRNLLVAKDLIVRHKLPRPANPFGFGKTLERLPAAALAHLPRKKDGGINTYALGFAAVDAHRYQLPELRAALQACLEANVRLVTSSTDGEVVLSQLLARIIAGSPKC